MIKMSSLPRPSNLLRALVCAALVLLAACQPSPKEQHQAVNDSAQALELWYPKPAETWTEALPLGNGRLGAMVFGGVDREVLQLNEDTVWGGGPQNNVTPSLKPHLERISELVLANRHEEAQAHADEHIKSSNHGMPYQTVGNLSMDFQHGAEAENYRRSLDIGQALAKVQYQVEGIDYQRETFTPLSAPVVLTRLNASEAGQLNLEVGFDSPMQHKLAVNNQQLQITGRGTDHEGVEGKVRFTALIKPVLEGGTIEETDSGLRIRGADSVTLYTSIATNFVSYDDVSADATARAEQHLAEALNSSYEQLRENHVSAYREQFDRVTLDLGRTSSADLPTDQRLEQFKQQNDPDLAALYFQFGRYLLISSSQPGTQPANLQGIWNQDLTPPWDSKYTLNINAEMNYWPAESTNLSELHEPLFAMLKDLSVTGQESARQLYDAEGWMVHHNTDIWRITGQVDGAYMWGQWLGGAAWLSQHIGYRYHHTGDRDFLAEHYPVLREAARFYAQMLTEDPDTGWLVLVPSNSPENDYLHRDDGVQAAIDAGVTMDNQLVFDLFSLVMEASDVLERDQGLAQQLKALRERLPPMQIGQHGQLQEWLQDWDSPEDKHRHVSHLYGLHPSNQISPYRTPELFSAVRTSMEMRGDESTGWSMGWKVGIWARLQDGNRAYKLLTDQIKLVNEDTESFEAGGTYTNMFAAHPPYQIDGNFGVTAGIAEMLVQSHDGAIHLLPALPDAWPEGKVTGLVTRGGFVVDMAWKDGKVTELKLHSRLGGPVRLRSHSELKSAAGIELTSVTGPSQSDNPLMQTPLIKEPLIHNPEAVAPVTTQPTQLVKFSTEAGQSYRFTSSNSDQKGTVARAENTGVDCPAPELAEAEALPAIKLLPDPFTSIDGKRLTAKDQWRCRRAEISAQLQKYESGPKPPKPDNLSGTVTREQIEVEVEHQGKAMNFTASITMPTTGQAPYPAMIGVGGSNLDNDYLASQGIAVISFDNNGMGAQSGLDSRGTGKFFDLYGNDHPASSLTAWAWGISRLIDVIENSDEALIDVNRLGVTGCSRNGKGALLTGALDERIALTIAQEAGAGGSASWRASQAHADSGKNVQTLSHAANEQPWFRASFDENFGGDKVTRLPFDHHQVMGMVAPRGLLVLDNDIEWLGPLSGYIATSAAKEIYTALGVPENIAYSEHGGHPHCQLPDHQQEIFQAYVQKFLLDDAGNTDVMRSTKGGPEDVKKWIDWSTPTLN